MCPAGDEAPPTPASYAGRRRRTPPSQASFSMSAEVTGTTVVSLQKVKVSVDVGVGAVFADLHKRRGANDMSQ